MNDVSDGIDLYWLPLGAGGWAVRWNGRLYEAMLARRERRTAQPLFHSALEVHLAGARFTVEMAPVWNLPVPDRGAVVEGPVGAHSLGRFRAFRYEVRRWRDGTIPDVDWAVGGAQRVSDRADEAATLLGLVAEVPPLVWGRDELHAGEMWNSNSLISWLLARTGLDTADLSPPNGGRAPGWRAGLHLAAWDAIRFGPPDPRPPRLAAVGAAASEPGLQPAVTAD
jgi:hypothetical protein